MKYEFKTVSIFYFTTTFLVVFVGIVYTTMSTIGKLDSSFFSFVFAVIILIVSYWIAYKLTIGQTQITLSKKTIDFFWMKKPILSFQNSVSIDMEKIESWKYRHELQYSYFKIYGYDIDITIMRLSSWVTNNDDFHSFIVAFEKRIEKINKKREKGIERNNKRIQIRVENKSQSIVEDEQPKLIRDRELDFYNSNLSKILFMVYVVSGVMGVFYLFKNWNTGKPSLGIIVYGVIGSLFYFNSHYNRKKNKK